MKKLNVKKDGDKLLLLPEKDKAKLMLEFRKYARKLTLKVDVHLKGLDKVTTYKEFMNIKVELLCMIIHTLPFGNELCPYCTIFGGICPDRFKESERYVCEYAKVHGCCYSNKSAFYKLIDKLSRLKEFIRDNY